MQNATSIQTHHRSPRNSSGFTLIEVLVVVSIIVIVIGVIVAGISGAFGTANDKRTGLVLQQLANSIVEYEAQTGLDFPLPPSGTNYYSFPASSQSDHMRYERSIDDYIEAISEVPEANDAFELVNGNLRPNTSSDSDNDTADGLDPATPDLNNDLPDSVLDAWGNPIRFVPTSPRAGYPTYRAAGLPIRRDPYFASAGTDGIWGTFDSENNPLDDGALDNIYSFNVE